MNSVSYFIFLCTDLPTLNSEQWLASKTHTMTFITTLKARWLKWLKHILSTKWESMKSFKLSCKFVLRYFFNLTKVKCILNIYFSIKKKSHDNKIHEMSRYLWHLYIIHFTHIKHMCGFKRSLKTHLFILALNFILDTVIHFLDVYVQDSWFYFIK